MSDKILKNLHHILESGGKGISLKMLLEDSEKDSSEEDTESSSKSDSDS